HEVVALEHLVGRRWLVDPAGDRLVVGHVEGVGIQAAVPAHDVERVERVGVDRADQSARPVAPVLDVDVRVLVRQRKGLTRYTYAQHPFDVVGWDGCLYPYAFNVSDYEPITGRIHQPPPAHQVFEGYNFVVCNFVPRKVDYHPLSIPVPYYHSNVDSDEVMFYCGGDYEARKGSGIGQGSISLHPGGHAHGPQPGAYERSIGAEYFDELAVMVDTFRPLEIGEGGVASEDESYAWSWSGRGPGDRDQPGGPNGQDG
ncbi:MAG: homogentisate 1,2-dioxygenase, partial [Actinomycetota bacterium]|nr:homogentisate 1,2-dioxygenase [Actinomycetota bacterium]